MKNKRIEEILLPPSIVSFTIVTCFYFLIDNTRSESTVRSLMFLMLIFLVLTVVCLVKLFKNSDSRS